MSENVTQKQKFFWNMMGSFCNALSSMVLGIIINRITGSTMAGIFAFAFSNAQLLYTIGAFEVRPLQSTDVTEKFSFSGYFTLRIVTCSIMMIGATVYVLASDFGYVKGMTIWVVAAYKMVEAIADSLAGMFQQHDRIDLSGKTSTFRPTLSTLAFAVTLMLTHNLILSSASMVVISSLLFLLYDVRLKRLFKTIKFKVSFKEVPLLVLEALPLFLASFINMYISNAPKYEIDKVFSEHIQNYYNIIFMPAFVINLFSLFAFRPLLTDLTKYWIDKDMKPFVKIVRNILLWILLLTIAAMIGSYLVGAQILGILNGISIMKYRMELVYVMLAGGVSAVVTFLYYIITVMRKQRLLLVGYFAGFVAALIIPRFLVPRLELIGAVISYGVCMILLAAAFTIVVVKSIIENKGKMKV